ncbi:MAG TPA: thiamine-phosphate kinase, partial [Allosphingosinicella sp.]|nr:thiamine-phosphate kinase [Allosphingosinicella sp.]
LIDSVRLAEASGAAIGIDLAEVPLSAEFLALLGGGLEARIEAATAGDDYELLFSAAAGRTAELLALADELGLALSRIGTVASGSGLDLTDSGSSVPLPPSLGWVHR